MVKFSMRYVINLYIIKLFSQKKIIGSFISSQSIFRILIMIVINFQLYIEINISWLKSKMVPWSSG